jgi:hypothetical protein
LRRGFRGLAGGAVFLGKRAFISKSSTICASSAVASASNTRMVGFERAFSISEIAPCSVFGAAASSSWVQPFAIRRRRTVGGEDEHHGVTTPVAPPDLRL